MRAAFVDYLRNECNSGSDHAIYSCRALIERMKLQLSFINDEYARGGKSPPACGATPRPVCDFINAPSRDRGGREQESTRGTRARQRRDYEFFTITPARRTTSALFSPPPSPSYLCLFLKYIKIQKVRALAVEQEARIDAFTDFTEACKTRLQGDSMSLK